MSPPSHKGSISGLRETFIKRYIVERINKAEIRPEEVFDTSYSLSLRITGDK